MRLRGYALVFGVLLLMPTAARASDHRAGIYAAVSDEIGSILGGFYASGEVTLPKPRNYDVNVLVDFGVHSGSLDDNELTRITLMFGGGWTFPQKPNQPHLVSLHGLLGFVDTDYDNPTLEDGKDFAGAVGIAWEFVPGRTDKKEGLGMRTQFDVVFRGDGSFARLSAGAVYRFRR
jgi:hypothetical protein